MPSHITVSVVEKVGVLMERGCGGWPVRARFNLESFTLITPGLISNKISMSGGSVKGQGQGAGQQVCMRVTVLGLLGFFEWGGAVALGGVTFKWLSQNRPHFRLKDLLCLNPQQPLQEVSQELLP